MQPMTPAQHLRVLPELRAVHVERSSEMFPCDVLYFTEKYDLGGMTLPLNFHKVGLIRCVRRLLRSDATVLEVPEPLWLRFLPRTIALLAAWRFGGLFTSEKRFAVTYAIENNDLPSLIGGGRKLPRWLVASVARVVGFIVSLWVDRIAYGSEGAQQTYSALSLRPALETRLFPELPVRSTVPASPGHTVRLAAIFIGQLEERKGIVELMDAWAHVEVDLESAVLTVVGSGELEDRVRRWSVERPHSRRMLGQLEHEAIGNVLIENDVLIAPSRRVGRWKEQIGLPIGEALSHGLTIVTSSDTGLADWLQAQGHHIISPNRLRDDLTRAVEDALSSPLDRSEVQSSLPLTSGRIAADHWMHSAGGAR